MSRKRKLLLFFSCLIVLSLLLAGCQPSLAGEATKMAKASKSVEKVRNESQGRLSVSEARKLQEKISTNPGRITMIEEKAPLKREGGRGEEGEEEFKSLTIPIITIPPLLNMKGIDYQPGQWEKITGSGTGVYTGVSAYTNSETKKVEEILAIAGGQLWVWDVMTNQAKWRQIIINNINNEFIEAQVDPNNKNHFIVALKELTESNGEKLHVYSTVDGGKKWDAALSLANVDAFGLTQGLTVHFFDSDHVILMHRNAGVFTSSDSGKTWKQTQKKTLDSHSKEFASFNNEGGALLYIPDEHAIFASYDFGNTWTKVKDIEKDFDGTFGYAIGSGKNMYVVMAPKDGGYAHIFRTQDGINWNTYIPYISQTQDGVTYPTYVSSWPMQNLVVDQNNADHLIAFIYVDGPFESFDGGKSWKRYYETTSPKSGIKIDTVKEINCEGCGLPYDVRATFVDKYNHILYAADQGLFMVIPKIKVNDIPIISNIAKPLSFEEARDIKVDSCGNLYYGVWHRSPVIKTKEGYYYAEGPEKLGFILTDPSKCTNTPALPFGAYGAYPDINNYVQNSQSYDLSFAFKDFKPGSGSLVYFKNRLYAVNMVAELIQLDIFGESYSPVKVFSKNINFIFKSVGGSTLYAVDSGGAIWETNDGEKWDYYVFPMIIKKLHGGTASASSYVLVSDSSWVGSVNSEIKSWPNTDKITSVLADKSCQTRLYGIADAKDKNGIDIKTVKVSSDFGQSWQEFGAGITGRASIQLGDTDGKYLYVATIGNGVWKRSTERLMCKKWIEIEQKFSAIK